MTTAEEELRLQLSRLRGGIREIAHDISNPLGILRMTSYYLQHGNLDREKQEHYYNVIGETVERVEAGLKRLRALSDMMAQDGTPPDPPAGDQPR